MSDNSLQQSTQLLRQRLEKSAAAKTKSAPSKAPRPGHAPVAEQRTAPSPMTSSPPSPAPSAQEPAPSAQGPAPAPQSPAAAPQCKAPVSEPAPLSEEAGTSEQRQSHRKSTRLAGVICNAGSRTAINCIIRDMSAAGAFVVVERCGTSAFSGTPQIGDKFTLYLTYDRMAVPCALEWRKGEKIGASFLTAPTFY